MRLALLTGAAAVLSLAAASGARAETVYIVDPYAVTAPGYVYGVPRPLSGPGYIVSEPGYAVVAPPAVVVAPPAPVAVAPAVPVERGIVTTGYRVTPSCFVDWGGVERCY